MAAGELSAQSVPVPSVDIWRYRVQPGDNLYDIARDYLRPGYGWRSLQRINRVPDPRQLTPERDLLMPVDWLRTEAGVARIVYLRGDVARERGGGAPEPLTTGDVVQAGDVVVCGVESEVTLRLDDGSRVLIGAGSRLVIEQLLRHGGQAASAPISADLRLEQGEADTRVEPRPEASPRFRVRTPALTLGVRGTSFRARVTEQGTVWTEVATGRVAAADPAGSPQPAGPSRPRRVSAGPGMAAVASASAAASPEAVVPPVPLPAAEPAPGRVAGGGVRGDGGGSQASELALLLGGQGLRRDSGEQGPAQPTPLLAAPDLSGVPRRIERLPLDLGWSGTASQGYRVQVYEDPALERRRFDQRVETARLRGGPDLPDGDYVLRVRGIDAQGLEGRDALLPLTIDARPEPPFISTPRAGGRVYGEQVRLSWTRSLAAGRYRLQIGAQADPGQAPVLDRQDLDQAELLQALPPGHWHWRVASIAPDGEQGPWSDVQGFELRQEPAGPEALSADAGEDGRLVVRWPRRQPDDRYELQLVGADHGAPAPDPRHFEQPTLERRLDAPEFALDALPPGRYLMRVRTVDADGHAGPWGTPQAIEMPKTYPLWRFLPILGALLFLL